jgi:hypothetical protein
MTTDNYKPTGKISSSTFFQLMSSSQVGTQISECSEFDVYLTLKILISAHNIDTSFLYAFMKKKENNLYSYQYNSE